MADGAEETWNRVGSWLPQHLDGVPDLSDLPHAVAELRPVTLTHNDLHAENILVSPDRLVFVDWQNASWGTPAYDVANLVAGCAKPDVQRHHRREVLAHYAEALRAQGGPALPNFETQVATASKLLFAWMLRYLASVTEEEAAERTMLLSHWERVCAGVAPG